MRDGTARRLAATACVLLAVAIGACGRRGAPVAPEQRVPALVGNLDGYVHGRVMELSWDRPRTRMDGTPLRDLTVMRVFRAEDAGTADPKPALARDREVLGYREIATIRMVSPAPATIVGDRVTFTDATGLTPGRRYTYVVVTEDSLQRMSPPSARLPLRFVAAPQPPGNLVAEPGETEARVSWTPPARLIDGTPVTSELSYEVFRGAGADATLSPVGKPIAVTRILDRPLENDRAYEYAVRVIRVEGQTRAISELTPRVRVTPVDMTPPAPPADLVAIPSQRTVRLSWKASAEPDVARYVVYRAAPGGEFSRLGSVTVPGTTFVDTDVPAGRWRYAVTAEDAGSRKNESTRSNVADASIP
jgi:hypothetical protein